MYKKFKRKNKNIIDRNLINENKKKNKNIKCNNKKKSFKDKSISNTIYNIKKTKININNNPPRRTTFKVTQDSKSSYNLTYKDTFKSNKKFSKFDKSYKNQKSLNLSKLNRKELNPKQESNFLLNYTDKEINSFKYEIALKYDKRTYFQYYLSLLKT